MSSILARLKPHKSIFTVAACFILLQVTEPIIWGISVGGFQKASAYDPWRAELPSDSELLAALSNIQAPSIHTALESLPFVPTTPRGLCSWQQRIQLNQAFSLQKESVQKQRVKLLHCCVSDFSLQRQLIEEALLSLDAKGGITSFPQDAHEHFEVFRGLMRTHDVLQVQLLGREFLRLKREAARRRLRPHLLTHMTPAFLEWWEWLTQRRKEIKKVSAPPPLKSLRLPFCTRSPYTPFRTSSTDQSKNVPTQLTAHELARALLSLSGAAPSCLAVAFPWAQLLGAAVAAGEPYEKFTREGAHRVAQSALKAAQLATRLQIYEAHVAAGAGDTQGSPSSPLLTRLEEDDSIQIADLRDPNKTLAEAAREQRTKSNEALEDAKAMAAETEIARKRRMQLARIDPIDVCLASLAALGTNFLPSNKKQKLIADVR
ncbi:hypothetical protein Emed_005577 [Eimeria media]